MKTNEKGSVSTIGRLKQEGLALLFSPGATGSYPKVVERWNSQSYCANSAKESPVDRGGKESEEVEENRESSGCLCTSGANNTVIPIGKFGKF